MNSKKSLVSLHYYPIKGCKVIDCRRMKVNPMGPEMDFVGESFNHAIVEGAGRAGRVSFSL